MTASSSYPLSFAELRAANLERCETSFHPLSDWSETDWMCAVAGEVGEAANLIKKRRRPEPIPVDVVMDELADAVIYLDLLAARLGEDLGRHVARKFDVTSRKVGSSVFLGRTVVLERDRG